MLRGSHPRAGAMRVTGSYSEGPVALTPAEFGLMDRFCGGGCGRRVVVRIVLIILVIRSERVERGINTCLIFVSITDFCYDLVSF